MYSHLDDSLELPASAQQDLERLRNAVAVELTLVAVTRGLAGLLRHLDEQALVNQSLNQLWPTSTVMLEG